MGTISRFRAISEYFNEDTFVYVAAFGLFTEVSYKTSQQMKNIFGHVAYIMEGAKCLHDIPSYNMQVEYDGRCISGRVHLWNGYKFHFGRWVQRT